MNKDPQIYISQISPALRTMLAQHSQHALKLVDEWPATHILPPVSITENSESLKTPRHLPLIVCHETSAPSHLPRHCYWVKLPAKPSDIMMTIRNAASSMQTRTILLGDFKLDLEKRLLLKGDDAEPLTEKEADMLAYLIEAEGAPVSRQELLEEVWGYQAGVTTHTLETHIYRLRQKLGDGVEEADEPTMLVSAAGGYRLVYQVST